MVRMRARVSEVTYQSCWYEGEHGVVKTFDGGVSRGVEKSIERDALEAVDEPLDDGEGTIQSDCAEYQGPESLGGEAKVKEKEGHLDYPMHQDVVEFLDEKCLKYVREV